MKADDPDPSSPSAADTLNLSPTGATESQATGPTTAAGGPDTSNSPAVGDDVHLSELVRSLRSLASDSPERQALLEQIARDYASGAYEVDASATASKIIDDTLDS